MRKILHIDMDAFYAAVEQRDNLAYRGKPVAVGRSAQQRGVIAAASYEARAYGIHSAMPTHQAMLTCPELILVPPRFEVYRGISLQIRGIFHRYTDEVEPVALDEAYLDVTDNKLGLAYASQVAKHIRHEIYAATGLTASAGVSVNKFLAKMASGQNKPNGLTVILPEQAAHFVARLPVTQLHGVGAVTAQKMHLLGIYTGADLARYDVASLQQHFGKQGHYYYQIAQGLDERAVEPHRVRKSLGVEVSFTQDLTEFAMLLTQLAAIAATLTQRAQAQRVFGKTITLKIKLSSYQQFTRSTTLAEATQDEDRITATAHALCQAFGQPQDGVRLLGITLSNLEASPPTVAAAQLALFD